MFESLEQRVLLTLVPDASNTLTLNGTAGNDVWEIDQDNGIITLRNSVTNTIDSTAAAFNGLLVVNMGDGNDFLRLRTRYDTRYVVVRTVLTGGLGNDTLIGGENRDNISGNDGDDRLDGRGYFDYLDGGNGFDTADYSYRTDNLKITLDGQTNDGGTFGENDTVLTEAVLSGAGNDALFGDAGANLLDGGAGNDTIEGGPGNDTLTGGLGLDQVFGEDGNDFLFAREGAVDQINDGLGTDSASVDSTQIGDLVNDVPTVAAPPAVGSVGLAALSSLASSPTSSLFTNDSYVPDSSFGTGGKVVRLLDGQLAQINDIALQKVLVSPGVYQTKIVAVGTAIGARGDYDFAVLRFNSDGSPDASFGNGGIVTTDFSTGSGFNTDVATSLAIDAAGRIIVVGASLKRSDLDNSTLNGFADYAIARYLPNGALDASFSGDGIDTWDTGGPQSDDRAAAVAIQTVGSQTYYVVAGTMGFAFKNANPQFPTADVGLVRWGDGGTHDSAFGLVRTQFGDPMVSQDYATGLAIDPATGNLWLAGYSGANASSYDLAIAGYTPGGALIPGAKQTLDLGRSDQAFGLALQGSKAIVVGASSLSGNSRGVIASFNISTSNPVLGPGDMIAVNTVADSANIVLRDVSFDSLGRGIAVGSIADATGASDFLAYRFETTYLQGDGATAMIDFGAADAAYAIAVQSDDKIIAAGLSGDDLAMARFELKKQIAEILLTPDQVQSLAFTYVDPVTGQTLPLPSELSDRLRFALAPDGTLTINGTANDDDINVTVDSSSGFMLVTANGAVRAFPAPAVTKVVINGRAGNDILFADATVSVPVVISGGDGNDTAHGGSGNDILNGDNGNDILVGAAGKDALAGSFGRDILIGGAGADSLDGGDDDDILIGGYTSLDDDLDALSAIQAEWTTTLHAYTNRVANLNGTGAGTGFNGTTFLRPGNSANKNVFDDSAIDTMTGGGGQDWFLASTKGATADLLTDRTKSENLTQV
jgi:uncharacterized delta-60 repeat protein